MKELERELHVYQTETEEEEFDIEVETNMYNTISNYITMNNHNYVDHLDRFLSFQNAECLHCLSEYDRVSGTPVVSLSGINTDNSDSFTMFDTSVENYYISVGQGWDSYYGSELEIENQIKAKLANAKDLSDILDVIDPLPPTK